MDSDAAHEDKLHIPSTTAMQLASPAETRTSRSSYTTPFLSLLSRPSPHRPGPRRTLLTLPPEILLHILSYTSIDCFSILALPKVNRYLRQLSLLRPPKSSEARSVPVSAVFAFLLHLTTTLKRYRSTHRVCSGCIAILPASAFAPLPLPAHVFTPAQHRFLAHTARCRLCNPSAFFKPNHPTPLRDLWGPLPSRLACRYGRYAPNSTNEPHRLMFGTREPLLLDRVPTPPCRVCGRCVACELEMIKWGLHRCGHDALDAMVRGLEQSMRDEGPLVAFRYADNGA